LSSFGNDTIEVVSIDDDLRVAQSRLQRQKSATDDKAAQVAAARAAYHAEEDVLLSELKAAGARTLELLTQRGQRHEIQAFARSRFGRNRGLIYGWPLLDPMSGSPCSLVLLESGDLIEPTPRMSRSAPCAGRPPTLELWLANQVRRARYEITTYGAESPTSYYAMAFDDHGQPKHVQDMRRQLGVMRDGVMKALGEMLTAADVSI